VSGFEYIPRVGTVIITTLTLANTWYQVLTEDQAKSIRGLKIKSRFIYNQSAAYPFDIAFSATPGDNFYSSSGGGMGDTFSPSSGIWARSPVAGIKIEILTYS